MGYIAHHAIVVTSWQDEAIESAHAQAVALACNPSPIVDSNTNGYRSFLIPPDGSKEGWDRSAEGDAARAAFIAWTRSTRHDDGSGPLAWAEVRYSGDDNAASITDHAWNDEVVSTEGR